MPNNLTLKEKKLIAIVGPTGAGKTSVSIALAKHFSTEIISSDSRQIFKDLTIGTAAATPEEQDGVRHHFVGTMDVTESFNAFEYEKQALALMGERFVFHNPLIMCGGSMLYIDAVCQGIDVMPDVDISIRESLKERVKNEGLETLLPQLQMVDAEYYNKVDLKNPARVIHGLEVFLTTGKPISSYRKETRKERPFEIVKIGVDLPRAELYERINHRVDLMLEAGLLEEAKRFYPFRDCNALKTVGYRELFDFFDGNISQEKAIELIKRNSRRYAKKQLTWFRKDKTTKWFSPFEVDEMKDYLSFI